MEIALHLNSYSITAGASATSASATSGVRGRHVGAIGRALIIVVALCGRLATVAAVASTKAVATAVSRAGAVTLKKQTEEKLSIMRRRVLLHTFL